MQLADFPDLQFDEYGFLVDPQRWNREAATALARELGIGPLSEQHWQLIELVRRHYLESGAILPEHVACHHIHQDHDCVRQLFGGPLELWKVAGLPYPGIEACTYMENEEAPRS